MSNEETESIGARLKRLRLARGLSQRDLSEPGVSYAYISRIEAEARTPSVKALRKLAPKLGVSLNYLETGNQGPVDAGVADTGSITLRELTEDELRKVQAAADAAARAAATLATVEVLDEREQERLRQLEEEADKIRRRRAASGAS